MHYSSAPIIINRVDRQELTETFASYYYKWVRLKAQGWSPGAYQNARLSMRPCLQVFGNKPLNFITQEDIQSAFVACPGSWAWRNTARAYFRAVIRTAICDGLADPGLLEAWPRMKDRGTQRPYYHFSKLEIEKLVGAIKPKWKRAVGRYVWASCYLGLRKGALYQLTWGMVLEDWWLSAPSRIIKQRKDVRMVIPPALREELGARGNFDDLLLPGLPHPNAVGRILHDAAKAAGLDPKRVYPHQFRRTWCAWAKASGMTKDQAQAIQRWDDSNVFSRYYWPKVDDQEHRMAMERL